MVFRLFLLLGACAAVPDIKHVVLLLFENRGFDHFFGFAGGQLPGINGLTGHEFNYNNVSDPTKGQEFVKNGSALYVCNKPASNSFEFAVEAFFAGKWNGSHPPYVPASMGGFVQANKGKAEVMWQFSPKQLPIKMALAKEFGLFDSWYPSFPGPSTPNHLFLQTGTSAGCTETDAPYHCQAGQRFPQRTIYENLLAENLTWAYYYNDSAWNSFIEFFETPEGAAGIRPYSEFYNRAAEGTLPTFSLVLPRQGRNATTGEGSNDDHPCHDIALGEKLLKDTYEALRAGKGWNNTLLLVTYDDEGGWYDHKPVFTGAPAPDDESSCPDDTDFTWLGARVPTLLISPWVSKGRVIHEPSGPVGTPSRPAANSQYEHTSLLATLKNLFGLPNFLTRRDAWAASFHNELTEPEPRTDTPYHLPEPPAPSSERSYHGCIGEPELTRRQFRRSQFFGELNQVSVPVFQNQDEAETWILGQETSRREAICAAAGATREEPVVGALLP
eukprot:c7101_g1_i1.p1 GENE.c7101_g1_i1~~c7101_g1_i1.p1  ORF type:complete len:509 (+),score=98.51 c7101_g1_i1:30-1529(+)